MVWGGMAIILIVSVGTLKEYLHLAPPCVFRQLTGIPCLTCGSTRSLIALSQFRLGASFLRNPLAMLVAVAAVLSSLLVGLGLLWRRRLALTLSESEKKSLRIVVFALVLLNWVFLILKERL
jgi:hypothetical protein